MISVTGPRQSGKTTLVKNDFKAYEYLSLEDLDVREEANTDPRGFLEQRSLNGFILDEVQNAPLSKADKSGIVFDSDSSPA